MAGEQHIDIVQAALNKEGPVYTPVAGDEWEQALQDYVDYGWLKMGFSAAFDAVVYWPTRIGAWVLDMELPPKWYAG